MNNLLLCLIISVVCIIMIICSTYKDNRYKTNDYIKMFLIILSGSFIVNLFNNNKGNVDIKTEVISPRLGNIENIAKPPF